MFGRNVLRRPFRFGVGPGAVRFRDSRQWLDFARKVEDLGFSTLSVGDHLTGGYGPISAMTAAACATTQLRIGALTFCNDYRHPLVLAQEIATLDAVSDGRIELGLGAGWMRADYERSGISMDPASVRIERLSEAVAIVKAVLGAGAGATNYVGAHYRVTDYEGRPAPVQSPRPPILVGGSGPKVLALAAREADIVGLNVSLHTGEIARAGGRSATQAASLEKVRIVEAHAGSRWPDLELQVYVHVTAVRDHSTEGIQTAAKTLGISPAEASASPHVLVGSTAEVGETLAERREQLGVSYVSVSGDAVDEFAPVVARLAGA